jgi:CheY-like chemotaxis protein
VLLDLAMPGMDGWETLRRMRAMAGPSPQVAIISANAFDRGLDQGLGIAAQDFIVKPWRQNELLEWLERRLDLHWLDTPPAPRAAALTNPQAAWLHPPREALQALHALAQLGYFRGLVNKLLALTQAYPDSAPFLAALEVQVRNYQFEQVSEQLQEALDAHQAD